MNSFELVGSRRAASKTPRKMDTSRRDSAETRAISSADPIEGELPNTQIKTEPSDNLISDQIEVIEDVLSCSVCFQPPAFAKQCNNCHLMICYKCAEVDKTCKKCPNSALVEIRDKILKSILKKIISFKHKCSSDLPLKAYSEEEMSAHKKSNNCPSKKFKCFCNPD